MTDAEIAALTGPMALARKREVELMLAATRGDPAQVEAREFLKGLSIVLDARLRAYKEENKRRAFAGMGSPFYEVAVERLSDEVIEELERAALDRLTEREQRNAALKAKKRSAT